MKTMGRMPDRDPEAGCGFGRDDPAGEAGEAAERAVDEPERLLDFLRCGFCREFMGRV
jgi:hypothetical protein